MRQQQAAAAAAAQNGNQSCNRNRTGKLRTLAEFPINHLRAVAAAISWKVLK